MPLRALKAVKQLPNLRILATLQSENDGLPRLRSAIEHRVANRIVARGLLVL